MAYQKVCKQGKDDIIVKVNLQSPIPASFTLQLQTNVKNDAGMRLCKFTFTIISSLPCLHTFWHAIPISFDLELWIQHISNVYIGKLLGHLYPEGYSHTGTSYLSKESLWGFLFYFCPATHYDCLGADYDCLVDHYDCPRAHYDCL